MPKNQLFIRPFPGTPAALPLSGLFLFSPSIDMKLAGNTMRGAFLDAGKESLFKRMTRLQHDESPSAPDTLRELLAMFPDAPLSRVIEAALNGDAAALSLVESLGLWEAFLYDRWAAPGGELTLQGAFILEIERASKEPERLVRQRQFAQAAAALSCHPVLGEFLWPRALDIVESTTQPIDLLPLQASVALEIRLSLVALVDVTVARAAGTPTGSYFDCLIPSDDETGKNPTALFFRWLRNEAGAGTIDALLGKDKSAKRDVANTTTLKRWSNGSHQPDPVWLRALAKDLFGDADHKPLWDLYWASRYLNFIGHTAETMRERALQLDSPDQRNAVVPWPQLPFDCDSIPMWLATRYPFWLAYHRRRLHNTE